MGLYVTCEATKGKALWFKNAFPSIRPTDKPVFDLLGKYVILAIITNPEFDSAVVMEDQAMIESLFYLDPRNIEWLEVPKEVIVKLVDLGLCPDLVYPVLNMPIPERNEKLSESA